MSGASATTTKSRHVSEERASPLVHPRLITLCTSNIKAPLRLHRLRWRPVRRRRTTVRPPSAAGAAAALQDIDSAKANRTRASAAARPAEATPADVLATCLN